MAHICSRKAVYLWRIHQVFEMFIWCNFNWSFFTDCNWRTYRTVCYKILQQVPFPETIQFTNKWFCIQRSLPKTVNLNENIFFCNSMTFIWAQFLCDKVPDCPWPDTSDEIFCQCDFQNNIAKQHEPNSVRDQTTKCPALFLQAPNNSCMVYHFAEKKGAKYTPKKASSQGKLTNWWCNILWQMGRIVVTLKGEKLYLCRNAGKNTRLCAVKMILHAILSLRFVCSD